MTDLRPDGLGQGIRHRSVGEGAEQAPLAVHREVAGRPDRRRANIARKDRVAGRELVEHAGDVLRMRQLSGSTRRELVEALARLAIVLQCRPQMRSVQARFERWQEGAEGRLDVPDEALVDSRAPTELLATDVDLDDPRVLRKELLVRK